MKSKGGNKGMSRGLLISALLTLVMSSGPAEATTVNYSADGGLLTATATFTLTPVNSTTEDLSITMTNTTGGEPGSYISSFGFDTTPVATVSSFTGGTTFTQYLVNTNFPSFQTIDICVFAGNNCSASNAGLYGPNSDTVSFVLTGSPSFTLDTYAIKFAGNLGSFEVAGTPSSPVPEPSTVLLLGSGLAGLALWRRKHAA